MKTITLTGQECKIFDACHPTQGNISCVVLRMGTFYATDGNILIALRKNFDGDGPQGFYEGIDLYFKKPSIMPNKRGYMEIEFDEFITPHRNFPKCFVNKTGKEGAYMIPVDANACMDTNFPELNRLYKAINESERTTDTYGMNFNLLSKITAVIGPKIQMELRSEYEGLQVWPLGEPKPEHPCIIMPMRT